MAKTIYRVTLPGKPWLSASREIVEDIGVAALHGLDYKISSIFQYITLTETNRDLERKLISRGAFTLVSDQEYQNQGTPISSAVGDVHQELGRLALYIPREIRIRIMLEEDVLVVESLLNQMFRIVLSFRDRPPTGGFGRRFIFAQVRFDITGVTYDFIDQSEPERILQLFVDFGRDPDPPAASTRASYALVADLKDEAMQRFALQRFGVGSVLRSSLFSGGCCDCCQGFRAPPCHDPGGPLKVGVHAKILVYPVVAVEQQVDAMNLVYAAADIQFELLSTEVLSLAQLNDYDAGACTSRSNPPDQREIAQYRAGVGPDEIAMYWVDTITSEVGWLAGCASYPPGKPMVVMARMTSQWVLGHELGHVLGLGHTPDDPQYRTRLMYPSDFYSGQPALSGTEITTARCSRYSK